MNKIIIAGLALFGGVALTACDNISEEDRFIPVEKPVLPPHAVAKNLLIVDFSGINCANCPYAALEIEKIKQANPERVISVAVHSSLNELSIGNPITNLNCSEADILCKYYNMEKAALPTAFFNGGEKDSDFNHWFTPATQALDQSSFITISATSEYDESERNASASYTVTFSDEVKDKLNILVWVIESGIVGYQQYQGHTPPIMLDYVHNHVLRGSLNGDWGTQLGTSFNNGQVIEGSVSGKINEKWKAENCHLVIFVLRDSDKFVEQTIEIPLVSSGSEEPEE